MDLAPKSLALFLRVAALGAIGKAGEEFALSSTNASQRIQDLESALGVKLFHRTTRSVSLTADGEVFMEHAQRILDDLEETKNVFTHKDGNITGHIRMTASASFGHTHITPFIPEFMARYPNVTLDIDLSDNVTNIVTQGYDVAFRLGQLASSSLLARRIDDHPRMLVASPEYLKAHGKPLTLGELEQHVCLPFERHNTWQFMDSENHLHNVTVSGPLVLNSGDAISQLVESGMGIALASLWHAGPSLQSGKIVPILGQFTPWPVTRIWSVRPPSRITPLRVRVFLDFFEEKIRATNIQRYGALISLR